MKNREDAVKEILAETCKKVRMDVAAKFQYDPNGAAKAARMEGPCIASDLAGQVADLRTALMAVTSGPENSEALADWIRSHPTDFAIKMFDLNPADTADFMSSPSALGSYVFLEIARGKREWEDKYRSKEGALND